jgi:hypothetical protein
MKYIAYHLQTTRYLSNHPGVRTDKESFESAGAAKAAITRAANRGVINAQDFAVAEATEFHEKIEKYEIVHNLMSGKPVRQSVNTPLCCDVSSETYWST